MFHNQWATQPRESAINDVESPCQPKEKYISLEELEILDPEPERQHEARTMIRFLRFQQRGQLILFLLLLLCASAVYIRRYRQQVMETARLTESVVDGPVGAYAAHSQPEFMDMVLVQTLDQSLVPTSGKQKERKGRLVIVGDVHGMKNELVKLLEKVEFDREVDHLILAGDMISKGPDSRGVLDLIMELGATAVRGNHEDRVLLAYDRLHSTQIQLDVNPTTEDATIRDEKLAKTEIFSHKGEYKDRLLAKELSRKHIEWLKKCPVILKVGDIEGMGQVLVVHAGLVPGVKLQAQDPYYVMNMRTIDLKTHIPSDSREGTEWTKLWNHYQEKVEPRQRSTVIYGHDSKRGLVIKEYSKGIDTGCLRGGQLTALIIEGGHSGAKQKLVQVNCADGRSESA